MTEDHEKTLSLPGLPDIDVRDVKDWPAAMANEPDAEHVLVCNPAHWNTPFDDNVAGKCDRCGINIYHRPYMPKGMTTVCVPCAVAQMHEERKDGFDVGLTVTPKTAAETKAYVKSKLA